MTDTYERCSCGARYKYKCSKESSSGFGKMCVKEYVPIPAELIEQMNMIQDKAEANRLRDQTILDADVAMELLDNPPAPNDKLMELLGLK